MSDVWFNRSVAEAVSTVTAKNLVFLVYIYDDSEQSKQLENTLLEDKVASVLKEKTVALKMEKDSENAKMFAQLYPISQVPVVYFILQGTIKDFGIHDLTSQDIINKVNALSPNKNDKQVKDKLEEIRKKREEEEKQKAKEREMKRREEGKMAQETRESLKEQQNKLYLEKKRKEKKEEEEYKKKIKEQIAKDRQNQIAARKAEKEKKALENQSSTSSNTNRSTSFYDHSNLNIKQLDGSSLRNNFSSSDTLATVSQWIDSTRTDGDMPYKLFAQFPNRNFDIGDEQRSLLDLKLCPSATLIMKPIKNATSAYGASNSSTVTSGWLNYLYSATDVVYNSVTSAASYLITPTNAPEPGQRLGGPSSSSDNNNQTKSNINTLRDNNHKKSDDDRQTYNGNSVNQE